MKNKEKATRKHDAMSRVAEVADILKRWNPIGVEPGRRAPSDEYDGYALHIVSMVIQGCTLEELSAHLERTRTEAMGLGTNPTSDREIADAIFNALPRETE